MSLDTAYPSDREEWYAGQVDGIDDRPTAGEIEAAEAPSASLKCVACEGGKTYYHERCWRMRGGH